MLPLSSLVYMPLSDTIQSVWRGTHFADVRPVGTAGLPLQDGEERLLRAVAAGLEAAAGPDSPDASAGDSSERAREFRLCAVRVAGSYKGAWHSI